MVKQNGSWVLLAAYFTISLALIWLSEANSDTDSLIALRQSLSAPNDVFDSWDSTLVNPCTWFHIVCNDDNRVTDVRLGNYNLSGHLVPQLGNLDQLQYLEIYENNIEGTIPTELGNLKNLISMDLYNNILTGEIPHSFGNLQSLRFLRLNDNKLTGVFPQEIRAIKSLMVINVSGNDLTGNIPTKTSFQHFSLKNFEKNMQVQN